MKTNMINICITCEYFKECLSCKTQFSCFGNHILRNCCMIHGKFKEYDYDKNATCENYVQEHNVTNINTIATKMNSILKTLD